MLAELEKMHILLKHMDNLTNEMNEEIIQDMAKYIETNHTLLPTHIPSAIKNILDLTARLDSTQIYEVTGVVVLLDKDNPYVVRYDYVSLKNGDTMIKYRVNGTVVGFANPPAYNGILGGLKVILERVQSRRSTDV